jgi:hypothetical protein
VTRTGDQIDAESLDALASPRCATVSGFSLHANVAVPARDPSAPGTTGSILCASSPGHRATPAPGRWAPSLSLQTPLARRNHPHRPGALGTTGKTRGDGPSSQNSSGSLPRGLGPRRQMEGLDRAHGGGAAEWRIRLGLSSRLSPAILTSNKPRNRGPVPPHRRLRLLPSSRTSVITPGRS